MQEAVCIQGLPKDSTGPHRCPLWSVLPTRFHGVRADSMIDGKRSTTISCHCLPITIGHFNHIIHCLEFFVPICEKRHWKAYVVNVRHNRIELLDFLDGRRPGKRNPTLLRLESCAYVIGNAWESGVLTIQFWKHTNASS